jgi:hypothetical protein
MNDLTCGQCGEPWEYYYLTHEMPEDDKGDVLRGDGCPACLWGQNDRATGEYQIERVQSISRNTDLDPTRYIP